MASLTHEVIKKYKLVKEKNNYTRVEVDDNEYKTIIANKVRVLACANANYPDDIYMEVFTMPVRGTEVTIWDYRKEKK